ncbi:MAG: hypothetical protein ACJ8DQ_13105 [Xanthobacteraceae bacterium]
MKLTRRTMLFAPVMLAPTCAWSRPDPARPLWDGARHTHADKARAIRRGLEFIYKTAKDEKNFAEYGSDYLWCFYTMAAATSDRDLKAHAGKIAQERAREWRRIHPRVPDDADVEDIADLVFGALAADGMGLRSERMRRDLARAASRFSPRDFLKFDPAREPIPPDVPEACNWCSANNTAGSVRCRKCLSELGPKMDPFDVLCDAVIATYSGERYGVLLGGRLADVLQWVPRMRPYPKFERATREQYEAVAYAITHIVYGLNDYTFAKLKPAWLPQEYEFLLGHLKQNIATNDAETMGEFLDTLMSFGLTTEHPLIRTGIEYLLSVQNADGSWGDVTDKDIYQRYHPTWTSVNGLMDYAFPKGERASFSEALRAVQGTAG